LEQSRLIGFFQNISSKLNKSGFQVGEYSSINYGLQFYTSIDGHKYLVRVYESKKGTRLDLSQIKSPEIKSLIENCCSNTFVPNTPQRTVKGDAISSGDPEELIGTDESGKGDYFGPLVIASAFVNGDTSPKLRGIGVDDSKKLTDKQIKTMVPAIKELCPYSIVIINNEKYNELYGRIKNLNRLLAWGHARAIENLLEKVECKSVLSDQFGDPRLIENALMEKGKQVQLMQRHRAEENVAVAAASILARYEFVQRMEQMEEQYGIEFPKGAASIVVDTGREFIDKFGITGLKYVAKLHFKTTAEIGINRY
jgi:ribonuclease HIII